MNRLPQYRVQFEWGIGGIEALGASADVLIIVDVLSFSTAVSVAVDRGASIIPYRFDYASAEVYAREQAAFLAVHRRDATPEHPYSLSPVSLKRLEPGSRVVLPSPNGATCCVRAFELGVNHVLIGSLRNAEVTAKAATVLGKRIAVIAAGETWGDGTLRPAVEDYLGAGAIISSIGSGCLSSEAAMAAWSFEAAGNRAQDVISKSVSGLELLERSYGQDVEAAVELNAGTAAAVLRGPEIRAYVPPQEQSRDKLR